MKTPDDRARARKQKARLKRRRPVSARRRKQLDRYATEPLLYRGRRALKGRRFYGGATPKEEVVARKRL